MYIVVKVSTKDVLVKSGLYGSGEPSKEDCIKFASHEFGVEEYDLSHFHIGDNTVEANEIFGGADFLPVMVNDEVVGVDFSPELAKPELFFEMNKEDACDDGVDSILVTCTARKESGAIDSSVAGKIRVPIRLPSGSVADKVFTFVAGVGTSSFKSTVAGSFIVPRQTLRFGVYRVVNVVSPNIYME